MKTSPLTPENRPHGQSAATIAEVLMSVAILGVMLTSLYGGMGSSFALTQLSRENLRGTQIMLERMEGIRLMNWNQVASTDLNPPTFTKSYYPLASNGLSQGITYYGTMTVTNVSMSPAPTYASNMAQVTVTILWTNRGISRSRTMSTYVARNGIQNYVFTSAP
jgi:hypothetical protein